MGLFQFFKKPTVVNDPVFGTLQLDEFKDNNKNFLTGSIFFNEDNPKVGLIISIGTDVLDGRYHQFFATVQENYPAIIKKIIPLITDTFRNWESDFIITNFNQEFSIDCITLPYLPIHPLKWEISFTTVHDNNHWVTVFFSDAEPIDVMVDG